MYQQEHLKFCISFQVSNIYAVIVYILRKLRLYEYKKIKKFYAFC